MQCGGNGRLESSTVHIKLLGIKTKYKINYCKYYY